MFERMTVKVLAAGQLYDSLETIFGPPARTAGVDVRHQGARTEFIQYFSDTGDPDPAAYRRGIPHLLRLMNSGQFAGQNLDALVDRLAQAGRSPEDVASDLFLTILSRRPTAEEEVRFQAYLKRVGSAKDACRELGWALMMTSEFALNR
jgi:hypothetical protein